MPAVVVVFIDGVVCGVVSPTGVDSVVVVVDVVGGTAVDDEGGAVSIEDDRVGLMSEDSATDVVMSPVLELSTMNWVETTDSNVKSELNCCDVATLSLSITEVLSDVTTPAVSVSEVEAKTLEVLRMSEVSKTLNKEEETRLCKGEDVSSSLVDSTELAMSKEVVSGTNVDSTALGESTEVVSSMADESRELDENNEDVAMRTDDSSVFEVATVDLSKTAEDSTTLGETAEVVTNIADDS